MTLEDTGGKYTGGGGRGDCYLAPEKLIEELYIPASDIYSLGKVCALQLS